MKVFLFVLAGLLFAAWIANLMMSGIYTGLYAMMAFIGAGLMLGLGGIVWRLEQLAKAPAAP